jgi:hypothetical protein
MTLKHIFYRLELKMVTQNYCRLFVVIFFAGILTMAGNSPADESSSMFPLGRSLAAGKELPPPYGIGLTLYRQTQDYDLKHLKMNLPLDTLLASGVDIENQIDEINLQFDLWLLPFVNIYGILGKIDGTSDIKVGPPLNNLEFSYEGIVYGAGFAVTAGTERFFGSLNLAYTQTDLDISSSSIEAWVFTPQIGIPFKGGAVWIGANYQKSEEKHKGSISLPPFGDIVYEAELGEKEPWNYLVGTRVNLYRNWHLDVEGGVGKRKSIRLSVSHRF